MSQPDFLYELFEDFMNDSINEDFSMDNGLICRWMTGQAKISPKISSYYAKPSNQKKLAETIGNICLITTNISQAKTHFKKALKIYENIWSDEPELIEAKYQEIQELYPQVGFSIGKRLSDF